MVNNSRCILDCKRKRGSQRLIGSKIYESNSNERLRKSQERNRKINSSTRYNMVLFREGACFRSDKAISQQ